VNRRNGNENMGIKSRMMNGLATVVDNPTKFEAWIMMESSQDIIIRYPVKYYYIDYLFWIN